MAIFSGDRLEVTNVWDFTHDIFIVSFDTDALVGNITDRRIHCEWEKCPFSCSE